MPNEKPEILEFFSRFPNEPLEFVIVTDINIKEHPNYYKAIFKNIKTGTYYSQKISPEMMRYKYKVGHIYTDGEHVGQNPSLSKAEFTVNQDHTIDLKRISSIMSETDAELLGYDGVSVTYDYTYDDMGRLVEVRKDGSITETYEYDNNGNRLSATVNGVSTTASYTLDDQLEVYGDNSYRYDDDGYLVEKTTPNGITTYDYGTMGELKEVVTPTQTITYEHNANNQRVAKLVNGTVVEKYLWANLTTLLAVYDSNDNLVQRFEYADQRMPVSMTYNNQKYYLHYDQVGSLRSVTDESHNLIKEVTYDTYGNILSDSNEVFKVPFGFAGGLYDSDTKLTRFGYRDYDSHIGKWIAKDPIDFEGGDANLYGYVLGDPVNFTDSSGLTKDPRAVLPFAAAGAIAGGLTGALGGLYNGGTWDGSFENIREGASLGLVGGAGAGFCFAQGNLPGASRAWAPIGVLWDITINASNGIVGAGGSSW